MFESNVIVVSAPNEIVIDKGSNDGVCQGSRVTIYSTDGYFKDHGDVLIVHRKVSVIRSNKDIFSDVIVGDLVTI
jgi:cell shape-determining protein MreC